MASLRLDPALRQAARDGVITDQELRHLAQSAPAESAPALAQTLERYQDRMTPAAQDRLAAFKDALPASRTPAGPSGRALDLLTGRLDAPARLPAWYPAHFDLDAAAQGARQVLRGQGVPEAALQPGSAHKLVLSDADFTLLQTQTPVLLRHQQTGELLTDPATGRPVELREGPARDLKSELAAVHARLPAIKLEDYAPDFHLLGNTDAALKEKPIQAVVQELARAHAQADTRDIIVTARSDDGAPRALHGALNALGAPLHGVLAVNNGGHMQALGLPATVHGDGKKALAMAALLKLLDPAASTVRSVRFLDDTDANLVAAMTTLPRLFPRVKFEFVDVVHAGEGRFEEHLVARSGRQGELVDDRGTALTAAQLESYRSQDVPLRG